MSHFHLSLFTMILYFADLLSCANATETPWTKEIVNPSRFTFPISEPVISPAGKKPTYELKRNRKKGGPRGKECFVNPISRNPQHKHLVQKRKLDKCYPQKKSKYFRKKYSEKELCMSKKERKRRARRKARMEKRLNLGCSTGEYE